MSCIDESFPLFCISKEAGLGLSEASIGKIMSGSGVIFAGVPVFCLYIGRHCMVPSRWIGPFSSSCFVDSTFERV